MQKMQQYHRPITHEEYESASPWGLYTSIDLYDCDPSAIRSEDVIREYTHELCDKLGVNRFGETQIVEFGDDPRVHGYSMVQLIETSLVSAHFAEDTNTAYIDVFSCKYYDTQVAVDLSKKYFQSDDAIVNVNLRK